MKSLLGLAATAAGVWVAVQIVPGLEFDGNAWAFVGVALLVAIANAIVRPILSLLSFPVILLTLGLFLLVINAIVLQLVVWLSAPDRLDLGLTSTGFFWATFLGALVISLVRWLLDLFFIRD
ncbi:MAG TPA: phage holin family protein [Acidimicrobiia bacterium]|nr:phage holin family protein [Acidimicrobiia bacterium]